MPKQAPRQALVYVMPNASRRRWRIILCALAVIAAGLFLIPSVSHPAKAAPVPRPRPSPPAVTTVRISRSTGAVCVVTSPKRPVKLVKVP